jgi:hypothetical protein
MLEEYQFWSAKKTRFWFSVSVMVLITSVLLFAGYGWILYQEKVQVSDPNSNQPSHPAATPYNAGAAASTNALAPSLSPLPPATNSN